MAPGASAASFGVRCRMPLRLISTDFDGTIFTEFGTPAIPPMLIRLIGNLQRRGVVWVINTGRDLGSLMETLTRAELSAHPDALVLVEREIYVRKDTQYLPMQSWNAACTRDHQELFARVAPDLPKLGERLQSRHRATFYEDPFSPVCVLAGSVKDADAIQAELEVYASGIANLSVVRNDVYIRFCHAAYNKGTALAEIARRLKVTPEETLAAGDHYNDLPMLDPLRAKALVAPANAIPEVQEKVRAAGGYVSHRPTGEGVCLGLEYYLERL